jgi:hypothetical protein
MNEKNIYTQTHTILEVINIFLTPNFEILDEVVTSTALILLKH